MKIERICQIVSLVVGARCAFAARNAPAGTDGIAYLDVANAYLRHDWHTAVNGYWGPLYSWLLALGMAVDRPTARTELPLARTVNFFIFMIAMYAFGACWRALAKRSLNTLGGSNSVPSIYQQGWTIFGYAIFLTSSAWFVGTLVPDLAVAAIVFASVTLLLKLEDGKEHSVALYVAWGSLLALGYYAKVVLFYFGIFLLFAIAIRHLRIKSFLRPLAATVTFLILMSPFAFFLSRTLGRFTIGETGKLAYAWLACEPETKTWVSGQDNAADMPFYPGKLLHNNPMVFQIPYLKDVTYAPWYDASRFDVRSHPRFCLQSQLKRIESNLKPIHAVLLQSEEALLLALVVLILYCPQKFLRQIIESWFYTIPILIIVAMYILVFVTPRYLLAFFPILWGTALASTVIPTNLRNTVRPLLLSGIVVFAFHVGPGLLHFLLSEDHSALKDVAIAESLASYGVNHGDLVASVGEGQSALWAHLARVTIAAESWTVNGTSFWTMSALDQNEMSRAMFSAGAKAIVWRRDSGQTCQLPWRELGNSSGCILTSTEDANF